jgi:hypothetical protein
MGFSIECYNLGVGIATVELILHRLGGFDIDGVEQFENSQYDRQADRRLGRRQHDHKDRVNLAGAIAAAKMGKCDIIDIGAVQNKFDAELTP